MEREPLISVIIPTYKTRDGLKKSIDSVLNQTYKHVEIVVVDDNNPKTEDRVRTEGIMKEYTDDFQVRYIQHEVNRNGAVARNTGIKASTGEFIAFLDDDDIFLPDKLQKEYEYLINHLEYDAVYTQVLINGNIVKMTPFEGNALTEILSERTRMFTSTLLFRRKAIIEIGGFDESFRRHQDYELLVKFFMHGFKIGCICEPLAIYCTSGQNAMSGKKLEDLKVQFLKQFDNILNQLECQQKGKKNWIIANNYAYVFVSHLARKHFYRALLVLVKGTCISFTGFFSFIFFFIKYHLKG